MSQPMFEAPSPQIGRIRGSGRMRSGELRIAALGFTATIRLWSERSRQRRHLRELPQWDDYLLNDIGVSREAALREAAKPFWRR